MYPASATPARTSVNGRIAPDTIANPAARDGRNPIIRRRGPATSANPVANKVTLAIVLIIPGLSLFK